MTSRPPTALFAGGALLLAGALAAGVAAAPAAQASSIRAQAARATPPPARPQGPGLMGTLISASGHTLKITVMTTHRSATIRLTSKTTYVVNGKPAKTHPTWKKGEQLLVTGTKARNGIYTAASVTVGGPAGVPGGGPGGPPPGGAAPVGGRVVSATHSSLVVKTSKGKTTFTLTSRTQYLVNGKPTSSRPALKAGQTVHVMAAKTGRTLTAQMVFIGSMPAPPSGGPPPSSSTSG